jgi:hypothetical protein
MLRLHTALRLISFSYRCKSRSSTATHTSAPGSRSSATKVFLQTHPPQRSDNENPSGVFFTLFLRSFILLRELECVVGASVVGGGAKSNQRCLRGSAVLQYTRKHGLVRERRVFVTSSVSKSDALPAEMPTTTCERMLE